MYIIDIVLREIGGVISGLLWLYSIVVIAACLVSFVNPDPWNPIVRFLRQATEPVFSRVRRWLPFVVVGGFDLSPIVVLVAIRVVDRVLQATLWRLAAGF